MIPTISIIYCVLDVTVHVLVLLKYNIVTISGNSLVKKKRNKTYEYVYGNRLI